MNIAVFGYGAMGQLVSAALETSENMTWVGAVEPRLAAAQAMVFASLEDIPTSFDVLIDFSHPANIQVILDYCQQYSKPLVICTTGLNEADLESIQLSSQFIPIVLASNTSQGVNLMHQLVAQAVKALAQDFDIELIEKHHNRKLDAPSGTANSLLETIQSSLPPSKDKDVVHGRTGMQKRTQNEIGVHSLRGGTIVGEHIVVFAGEDEIVEIKHTALSKKIFARGAVRAAQFIADQPAGLYSMKDVIRQ
ncbi:MAG: 4-hydroxy-tetrahydrodipicolinate reductase [Saprospiraceae bacterium]|nr:4-hydroxy-tetrahydrodipicolinate reductase [Saprospiraceae bacterium]